MPARSRSLLSLVLAAFAVLHDAPGTVEPSLPLTPGQTVAAELASGARARYRLPVTAGQFLRILVEQRGVDLVLELTDPSGRHVRRDDDNAMHGPLPARWVVEATGELLIEVSALSAAGGRYAITVQELRAAAAEDGPRVAADDVMARGYALLKQETSASLDAAVGTFEDAAARYRRAADDWGEENALNELGLAHFRRGRMEEALAAMLAAVPLARRAGFTSDEATSLSNAAAIQRGLGRPQPALEMYEQALALKRASGDKAGEATTLNNLGVLQSDLGRLQEALDSFERARRAHHETGELTFECLDLMNLGSLYHQLGQDTLALEALRESLGLARRVGSRSRLAAVLVHLARVEIRLGRDDEARAHLGEALAAARQAGDARGEARGLISLALLDAEAGRWPEAFEGLERALVLARVADRRMEAAALVELGGLHLRRGQQTPAGEALRAALRLHHSFGDREGEALARHALARLAAERGALEEARQQAGQALEIVESLRSRLANFGLRETYLASLPALYELSIDVLMRSHAREPQAGFDAQALATSESMRARTLLALLRESGAAVREGADPVLLEREKQARDRLTLALDRQMRLLSAPSQDDKEAIELSPRIERLAAEIEQVRAEIRVRSPRFAALTEPERLDLDAIQDRALDEDSVLLEYSLGEERSYLWVITRATRRAFELPGRAEIEALARAAHAELSTRPQLRGRASRPAVAALSRLVLDVARAEIAGRRILVVADGILHYIPFGALADPERPAQPLIEGHEVVGLPSASTLGVLRAERRARPPAARALVAVADPVFSRRDERVTGVAEPATRLASRRTRDLEQAARDVGLGAGVFPRLPFTRREAQAILRLVPRGQGRLLADFEASRDTALKGALADYRIIHFATHGFFNSTHPELSGLVLSLVGRDGRAQEGFLSATEAFNLRLGADLVVLSGCRTGLGRHVRGEGLVGLTRALMYAGAPRVVASVWKVDDEATAALMAEFYRRMLGPERLTPAAALRAAQRSLRSGRWSDPYFWAAFQIYGEPK